MSAAKTSYNTSGDLVLSFKVEVSAGSGVSDSVSLAVDFGNASTQTDSKSFTGSETLVFTFTYDRDDVSSDDVASYKATLSSSNLVGGPQTKSGQVYLGEQGVSLDNVANLSLYSGGAQFSYGDENAFFPSDSSGGFEPAPGSFATLTPVSGGYELVDRENNKYEFDTNGNITASSDAQGRETSYGYTTIGSTPRLTSVVSPFESITYGYTGDLLTSIISSLGTSMTLGYTSGKLTSVTLEDPDGADPLPAPVTTYSYNVDDRISTVTQAGLVSTYTYDTLGYVDSIEYSDGSSIDIVSPQYAANTTGEYTETITDSQGIATSYTYNELGYLIKEVDALGNVTTYERDENGLVETLTLPDPDGAGPLTSPVYAYTYDSRGNMLTETLPDSSVRTWVYHATWNEPTKYTDATGEITLYTYDATYQLLLTETLVVGNIDDGVNMETNDLTTTYTYTAAPSISSDPPQGLVETITDPDGVVTEYEYDQYGNTTDVTFASGTSDEATKSWTYDSYGYFLTETDERGNTTTYTYDDLHRVLTMTSPDPDGAGGVAATVTTYTYNSMLKVSSVDVNGRTTTYGYDSKGRLDEITEEDPDGAGALTSPETSYTYDSSGNVLTETDPLGNVTTYGYTDGLLTSITLPDPDGAGGLSAPVTSYTYNAVGRVLTETDPLSGVTTYTYDNLGRVTGVSLPDPDGVGSLTSLSSSTSYDAFSRVTSYTDFDGVTTTYTYDSEGNLLTETTPLGTTTYTYDDLYQLVEVETEDPDGAGPLAALVTTYTYTAMGQVASKTTSKGTTSYTYDHRGRLKTVTEPDPDGAGAQTAPVTSYTYDDVGNLLTTTDPLGHVTTYVYDNLNNLTQETLPDPDGAGALTSPVTTYEYNVFGELVSVTDPNGGETTYTYDNLGRLITLTEPDPDGGGALSAAEITYVYDAAGQLTSETDQLGNTTTYTYDNLGRLITETLPDPDGAGSATSPVYSYTYDAAGNLLTATDPLSRTTTYTYDTMGRLRTETLPDPDGGGSLSAPVTTYTYNTRGQLASVTDAESQTVSYTYNSAGLTATMTDPFGTTVYIYDALGRQIAIYEPDYDGAGSQLAPVTLFEYNDDGELAAVITRDGKTSYEYDNLGRIISVTEADPDDSGLASGTGLGSGTGVTGSASGGAEIVVTDGVVSGVVLTDGSSSVSFGAVDIGKYAIRTFEIANIGGSDLLISSITLPSDFKIISYSDEEVAPGESTTITVRFAPTSIASYSVALTINNNDSDESSFEIQLTGSGQASSNGSEAAASTSYVYNSNGRITSETDALSNTTSYLYDNLGRLTKKTDAEGGETEYTYDANGNMLTLTDPEENVTTWTYDYLNQVLTDTNQLSDVRSYEYDAAGNLTEYTDRNGRVTEYIYDDLQRRTAEKWMDGATVLHTLSYAYDAASQLTSASDSAATYTFTYDNLGRVTNTEHDLAALGFDVDLEEAYDSLGRRTGLTAVVDGADDLANEYTYDYWNRLTRVTQGGTGGSGGSVVAEKRVDFTYDAEDDYQFASITAYADLAGSELVYTSGYTYDRADRLTALSYQDSSSSTLAGYTWGFDSANRLTDFTVTGYSAENATYSYDDTSQLTGADRNGTSNDESYAYDSNGNRTSYTIGDNNQITSDGTYSYTYDDEGNRLTKTNISTGEVIEYQWDYRNRLTGITTKDSGGSVTHDVDYTYDIFNHRIVKTIDADGAGSGTATKEVYIYDGLREEMGNAGDHILFAFDESDDLIDRFLYGASVDQILAQEEVTSTSSAGDVLWALSDNLGSIRDVASYNPVTDTTTIVNHLAYDAFGNVTSESNTAIDLLFAYTGRERDEESALQYNRARYYDTGTGQWISQDPLGFDAGDENLYRYVGNTVLVFSDPSGLEERTWGRFLYEEVNPWGFGETRGKQIGEGIGAWANIPNDIRRFKSRLKSTNDLKRRATANMADPRSINVNFDGPLMDDYRKSRKQMMDRGRDDVNNAVKEVTEGAIAAAELTEACLTTAMGGLPGSKGNVVKEVATDGLEAAAGALGKKGAKQVTEEAAGQGAKQLDNVASSAKNAPTTLSKSADDIRFSQNSVSFNKVDRVTGKPFTYNDLVESMRTKGWQGDPVDVVRMPDGRLTSMDNTRIRAAREAGIEVKMQERAFDAPLTLAEVERFSHSGNVPSTWGEAIQIRIGRQSGGFGSKTPYGSNTLPRPTGMPE